MFSCAIVDDRDTCRQSAQQQYSANSKLLCSLRKAAEKPDELSGALAANGCVLSEHCCSQQGCPGSSSRASSAARGPLQEPAPSHLPAHDIEGNLVAATLHNLQADQTANSTHASCLVPRLVRLQLRLTDLLSVYRMLRAHALIS